MGLTAYTLTFFFIAYHLLFIRIRSLFAGFSDPFSKLWRKDNDSCSAVQSIPFIFVHMYILRRIRCGNVKIRTQPFVSCLQIVRSDPAHCLGRMNYLITLLEGGSVKSTGSIVTSSSDGTVSLVDLLPDNLGPVYAWQCLFSSAISQAEHQFAYNVDSTTVFAALLSGILGRHPEKVVCLMIVCSFIVLNIYFM